MTRAEAQVEIKRYTAHLQGVTAKSSPIMEHQIQSVKKSKTEQDLQEFSFNMKEKQRRSNHKKGR